MVSKMIGVASLVLVLAGCGREVGEAPVRGWPETDIINMDGGGDSMEALVKQKTEPAGPIAAARANARKLMHSASTKTSDPRTIDLFRRMDAALGQAKIQAPRPGHDLRACIKDPLVLAFVMTRSPRTIHVCARALSADPKELAQVLTHETAHVVGVHDECGATQVEVAIMRLSGARLAFKNGYMDRCGIR